MISRCLFFLTLFVSFYIYLFVIIRVWCIPIFCFFLLTCWKVCWKVNFLESSFFEKSNFIHRQNGFYKSKSFFVHVELFFSIWKTSITLQQNFSGFWATEHFSRYNRFWDHMELCRIHDGSHISFPSKRASCTFTPPPPPPPLPPPSELVCLNSEGHMRCLRL